MLNSILGTLMGKPKYTRAQLESFADAAAKANGIDPVLFRRQIAAESGFNPNARSKAGAMGLGQLMPGTAAGLGVKDPWDPQQNLDGAARYLAQQIKAFNGDIRLALAAYNAGPGAVRKYGKVPPYRETQNYVHTILHGYTPARNGSLTAQPASTNNLDSAIKDATAPFKPPTEAPPEINPLFTIASMNPTGDMWGSMEPQQTPEQVSLQETLNEIEAEINRRTGERRLKGQAYADALGEPAPNAPLPDVNAGMDKNASLGLGIGSALLGMFGVRPQSIAAATQGFAGARARKAQGKYMEGQAAYNQDIAAREANVKKLGTEYDIAGQGITDLEKERAVKDRQIFDVNAREDNQRAARLKSLESVIYSPKATKEDKLGALSQFRGLGGTVDPWLQAAAQSDGDTVTNNRARTQIAVGTLEVKQRAQAFAEGKWKDQVKVWEERLANDTAKWKAGIDMANRRLAESARQHNENLDFKNRELAKTAAKAAMDEKTKIVKDMEKTYGELEVDIQAATAAHKELVSRITAIQNKAKSDKSGVGASAARRQIETLQSEADKLNIEIVKMTTRSESLDATIRKAKEAMATEKLPEHPTG